MGRGQTQKISSLNFSANLSSSQSYCFMYYLRSDSANSINTLKLEADLFLIELKLKKILLLYCLMGRFVNMARSVNIARFVWVARSANMA